jgi:hypothetical protein
MFGDWGWQPERTAAQEHRFSRWLENLGDARLVIVEVGAGTAVPTVRMTSEQLARRPGATLIRINVREPQVPGEHVGIPLGGLEALRLLRERIGSA